MPIRDFLKEDYFEPEIMEAMRAAYQMARDAPQIENAADSMKEEGESDPARL